MDVRVSNSGSRKSHLGIHTGSRGDHICQYCEVRHRDNTELLGLEWSTLVGLDCIDIMSCVVNKIIAVDWVKSSTVIHEKNFHVVRGLVFIGGELWGVPQDNGKVTDVLTRTNFLLSPGGGLILRQEASQVKCQAIGGI